MIDRHTMFGRRVRRVVIVLALVAIAPLLALKILRIAADVLLGQMFPAKSHEVVADPGGDFTRRTGIKWPSTAVIVSVGQVWVTTISKDKELQISTLQHKADIESQERQKERELASSDSQRKRELDLNAARFLTENRKQIFVPVGFAHGFLVLSETATVIYKTSDFYAPPEERGILWNDPGIGITWPALPVAPQLNARDAAYPALAAAPTDQLPVYRS